MKRNVCLWMLVVPAFATFQMIPQAQAQEPRWIDRFECCDSGCTDGGCTDADCPYDWSGAYAGIHTGYAFLNPNSSAQNLVQESSDGPQVGGHLGYNFQRNRLVYGVEADFTLTELDREVPCFNPNFNCLAASDWNASLRSRLGFSFDRLLIYGTAGITWADYHGSTLLLATNTLFADETIMSAATVGAGLEYAVTERLRMRAEYRYANFDDFTMNYDVPYTVDPELHSINVGMNLSF